MPIPISSKQRLVSLDQFRGYTIVGMDMVNLIGRFCGHTVPLQTPLLILQLCRHDHAALPVCGRFLVWAPFRSPCAGAINVCVLRSGVMAAGWAVADRVIRFSVRWPIVADLLDRPRFAPCLERTMAAI